MPKKDGTPTLAEQVATLTALMEAQAGSAPAQPEPAPEPASDSPGPGYVGKTITLKSGSKHRGAIANTIAPARTSEDGKTTSGKRMFVSVLATTDDGALVRNGEGNVKRPIRLTPEQASFILANADAVAKLAEQAQAYNANV